VWNLHLDHKREDKRMLQLETFFTLLDDEDVVDDDSPALPDGVELLRGHAVLGDFNSLSLKEHYTREAWKHMVDMRAQSQWEEPRSSVYSAMINRGYVDTYWTCVDNSVPVSSNHATCWAGDAQILLNSCNY
jgi:hypothetical protein